MKDSLAKAVALYEQDQFSRAVLRFYDIDPEGWVEADLFEVADRLAAEDMSEETEALIERGRERSWKGRQWARTGVWPAGSKDLED